MLSKEQIQQIQELRQTGLGYRKISKLTNCARSTVKYYCDPLAKDKNKIRIRLYRKRRHPLISKIENFSHQRPKKVKPEYLTHATLRNKMLRKVRKFQGDNKMNKTFDLQDVLDKIGNEPQCYLTGLPIDLDKPNTYSLDHIIPSSRGGETSLDNLGLASRKANQSKTDMTPDEYINLCKLVLEHNGYTVQK